MKAQASLRKSMGANIEGSGESVHQRRLARTFNVCAHRFLIFFFFFSFFFSFFFFFFFVESYQNCKMTTYPTLKITGTARHGAKCITIASQCYSMS